MLSTDLGGISSVKCTLVTSIFRVFVTHYLTIRRLHAGDYSMYGWNDNQDGSCNSPQRTNDQTYELLIQSR